MRVRYPLAITRTSPMSGITRTMLLPVTAKQLWAYYGQDVLLQNAFPYCSPDQREFIKTGIIAEEWDQAFGEEV